MELKEFVQSAIEQVIQGVEASFPVAHASNAFVALNNATEIEFDVAVTASETVKSEGSAGAKAEIKVWGLGSIGAGGGGKTGTESTNSHVSRIKFSVPLSLPQDPKKVQERHEQNEEANEKMRQKMHQRRQVNGR